MFARTERLCLRPIWEEDAQALTRAIADEAIVRNLGRAPWPYTIESARQFIALEHDRRTPNFMVIRRTNGTPELIGSCGLTEIDDKIEIGYWIARPYWGLGYASEAAHAVMEIALSLGYDCLHAGYFSDNPASGNVLRKLGFVRNGPTRKFFSLGRGKSSDLIPMIAKDLTEILSTNEKRGGCNTALHPPAYYDAQSHVNIIAKAA